MHISAFDFQLPDDLIALRPAEPRDSARLLAVSLDAPFSDHSVRDLPELLSPGDCLVVNDTRVIPAELTVTRTRGDITAGLTLTLHQRTGPSTWQAFARPARKAVVGDQLDIVSAPGSAGTDAPSLEAEVMAKDGGELTLAFSQEGAALDAAIAALGRMPLPPYISSKRPVDATDASDYQTAFATHDGAVAAPTAGLHFTPDLLARLDARGITRATVTLHVGAGTFLPVKVDDTRDHKMHSEWGEISGEAAATINAARAHGGRVVAVGTTSLRLLETAAQLDGSVAPWQGPTDIFISPGYRFRVVNRLLTNFHLPKSTLFMLVSAFAGLDRMHAAYAHAIANAYRFYSFGDASLLTCDPTVPERHAEEYNS